ncbi:MAG: thioesterase [Acidobacteriota bacterium]|nr:thioesterase [Acidobacteriota bacterium]
MDKKFAREYQLHTYEIDWEGRAHPLALLDFLMDAAAGQAAATGFGVPELIRKGLTWLLSRHHVRIFHYPGIWDRVRVTTWASGFQRLFALRDFEMHDEKGFLLASATSSWVLMNLRDRKPANPAGFLPGHLLHEVRAMAEDFPPLPKVDRPDVEIAFRVRMRDVDFNRHVTNGVYIHWALEAVPEDVLKSRRPKEIEVGFRAEAFYGDQVVSRTQRTGEGAAPAFVHQIVNIATGTELTRLRTVWE